MNKVKLKLLSTQDMDETAIINVYFKDIKVVENYSVSTNGSEIIFNVDDFELYNKVKVDVLNFHVFDHSIAIKSTPLFVEGILVGETKILDFNDEDFQTVLLFLESVEISNNDGNTWIDVTPTGKNNPCDVGIVDDNFHHMLAYVQSKFSEPMYNYIDVENYPNTNGYANIFDKPSSEFFIPSFERIENINSVIIDNKLYGDLIFDQIVEDHKLIHGFRKCFYHARLNKNKSFKDIKNIQFFKNLETNQKLKISNGMDGKDGSRMLLLDED